MRYCDTRSLAPEDVAEAEALQNRVVCPRACLAGQAALEDLLSLGSELPIRQVKVWPGTLSAGWIAAFATGLIARAGCARGKENGLAGDELERLARRWEFHVSQAFSSHGRQLQAEEQQIGQPSSAEVGAIDVPLRDPGDRTCQLREVQGVVAGWSVGQPGDVWVIAPIVFCLGELQVAPSGGLLDQGTAIEIAGTPQRVAPFDLT